MATKKRKVTTAIVASVTALALLLGGTFAWQSINQTALNEASDVINPGGRLHDDFDGSNKDVYVENFADEDIFARIRLEEYFEIVMNYGTDGQKTETIVGNKTENDDGTFSYGYEIHKFDEEDEADKYWNWTTGGSTVFMPTFNKNKDSLAADLNGNYVDAIGGISNRNDPDRAQYENYVEYTDGETKDGNAIYDIDANMADELAQNGVDISGLIDGTVTADGYTDNVSLVKETHTAKETGNGALISMAEWLAMIEQNGGEYDADLHGGYWVYDTDGWVYWSAPIASGEATGLLLDSIELSDVMDDTWYYAINVVAQFVTAGDTGSEEDGTGFYDTANGTAPSNDALTLLDKIGVNDITPGTDAGDPEPDEMQTLILTETGDNAVYIAYGESVKIEGEDGADLSSIQVDYEEWAEDSNWYYDSETGILQIHGTDPSYRISDATGTYTGTVYVDDGVEDYDYYTYVYASTETPDTFTGNASHIIPGEKYYIYVIANEDPTKYEEEGYGVELTLRVTTIQGEEVTLTPGVDYTLTLGNQFEETEFYAPEPLPKTTEWCYTAELTIHNEDLLAHWLTIEAKAPKSNLTGNSWIIQEMVSEATIFLYEADGNHNRVTTTLLQPNTTYDIMVEVGGIVIYDSCHPDRVDPAITYTTGWAGPITAHDYEGTADITEAGKLYTGSEPGKVPSYDPEGMGGFMISVNIFDLRIPASSDQEEDITHAYVASHSPWLFEYGKAPMNVMFWRNPVMSKDGKSEEGVEFYVYDKANSSIADKVTYTITGNDSADTKVEVVYNNLNFEYDAYLKLGADETSEKFTIVVSAPGYISETIEVNVDYSDVTE